MGKTLGKEENFLKERGYKVVEKFEHLDFGLIARLVQRTDNRVVFMKNFALREDARHSTVEVTASSA